ncbi:hypothetical protein [Thermococcus sp.]
MIDVGTNFLMLGILVTVGIIVLKRFLSVLEGYAGFVVLLVGMVILFASELLMTYRLIVGVFLVIVGIALAS